MKAFKAQILIYLELLEQINDSSLLQMTKESMAHALQFEGREDLVPEVQRARSFQNLITVVKSWE